MSGHSKWHSIKHKKGAADAKRGKIFTVHAKLIAMAARSGGDPDSNPSLRAAIDNAKGANVPNTNIDRAIKRGIGDKDGAVLEEITYEGYGPAGIAVYIQALTDNKNRTVSNVKSILTKKGGNMGTTGSVAYMFKRQGIILIKVEAAKYEDLELAAIDAGADDIEIEEGNATIYTDPKILHTVKKSIEENGFPVESAEIAFNPETPIKIEDEEKARKVLRLIDALEEDDDVTNVFSNFDIPEEILEKLG